jgi:tryptophan-rich sensory protein
MAPVSLGRRERVLLVLWPAFVMAGVLLALVFVVVDPHTLSWYGGQPLDLPPQAVYTISFFIFWAVIAAAGAASAVLATRPLTGAEAPGDPAG